MAPHTGGSRPDYKGAIRYADDGIKSVKARDSGCPAKKNILIFVQIRDFLTFRFA